MGCHNPGVVVLIWARSSLPTLAIKRLPSFPMVWSRSSSSVTDASKTQFRSGRIWVDRSRVSIRQKSCRFSTRSFVKYRMIYASWWCWCSHANCSKVSLGDRVVSQIWSSSWSVLWRERSPPWFEKFLWRHRHLSGVHNLILDLVRLPKCVRLDMYFFAECDSFVLILLLHHSTNSINIHSGEWLVTF